MSRLRLSNVAGALGNRWVAVTISAVLMPLLAAAALLSPSASARPGHTSPAAAPGAGEPTPPPLPALDPTLFAAAAKRPPATAPLQRLPQVDVSSLRVGGIPPVALAAYVTAARTVDRADPGCRLRWWVVAGIGFVESGHAASGGSARPRWNGIATPPIYGPVLDGSGGFAAITDTDRGSLDGDRRWDRAVGPMQFLPSTWRSWGTDGRGRLLDPQDLRAAAIAAARYLCAGSADLSQLDGMATAVFSYNHSFDYVRLVLSVAARYAGMSPTALGVDRLPHDHPSKKPSHRHKAARAKASPSASPPSGSGSSSSSSGSSSASSSGSGSQPPSAPSAPTPSGSPSPSPASGGGPELPPLPPPPGLH